MRKRIILSLAIFLFGLFTGMAQTSDYLRVGGPDNDHGYSMVFDASNNIIIAGSTRSFGKGSDDYYLIKTDQLGELNYQKTYGCSHHEIARSVALAADGGYVIFGESWDYGHGREDMYLIKINENGEKQWDQFFGGYHTDQGMCVEALPDGYACLGYTSSQPGTTRGNFLLSRTDLEGNLLWENNYGTKYLDFGFCVKQTHDGGFALLGNSGGFFNLARADFLNHDSDIMLILTNPDGEELNRIIWGGKGHDWGKDMLLTEQSILVVGSSQQENTSSFDLVLSEISYEGRVLHESYYGGKGFEFGESICQAADSNLLLVGTSSSPSTNIQTDIYVVKTETNGNLIWEQRIGGSGSDYGYDVLPLSDSGCMVLGEIEDTTLMTKDVYMVRLNKNGDIMSIGRPDEPGKPSVIVYPNPAFNKIHVKWVNQLENSGILRIYTVAGELVYSEKISGTEEKLISLPDLKPQMLIYQITTQTKNYTGNLIIQ
ncbi:MAG: T9SS type A sorting domain-containing protein [Bacteroidales bacterium]|nr:T9SS type A sorting domain-containing protein [Bacteroidales bacterium]